MCTDHQTGCVLQWLLASVGIFALFLQTLCLLSSMEIHEFSFSVSTPAHIQTASTAKGYLQPLQGHSQEVEHHHFWLHEQIWSLISLFPFEYSLLLICSGVWSLLYSFYLFVIKVQAKFWRRNITLDLCEKSADFLQRNAVSFCNICILHLGVRPMNMRSTYLDSWLEDKCSGFENALAHYPLSNGLFLCVLVFKSQQWCRWFWGRVHYCNKMSRFAEMFRVPGEISIYGSFS